MPTPNHMPAGLAYEYALQTSSGDLCQLHTNCEHVWSPHRQPVDLAKIHLADRYPDETYTVVRRRIGKAEPV